MNVNDSLPFSIRRTHCERIFSAHKCPTGCAFSSGCVSPIYGTVPSSNRCTLEKVLLDGAVVYNACCLQKTAGVLVGVGHSIIYLDYRMFNRFYFIVTKALRLQLRRYAMFHYEEGGKIVANFSPFFFHLSAHAPTITNGGS